ncbi:MAG: MFS transporter [Alphaproteobacteria bacterium]|nr:MFS transporter [Alphaproteobacteria bacterium]
MAIARDAAVDQAFLAHVRSLEAGPRRDDLDAPVRAGAGLTARQAIAVFEAQVASRHCDLLARELKRLGTCYYTIGSSGHEGNAAVAAALEPTDPAFLHYRSGGFFLARAQQVPGPAGAFDVALGLVASADEPIAGGRHKVFGSVPLNIPPQTSTIASHLPKALGMAVAMDRQARLEGRHEHRIVVATFGDASANHSTTAGAVNAAGWAAWQKVPVPLLMVCEDNGIGISVRTPEAWVPAMFRGRAGIQTFDADGLDLVDAYDTAAAAAAWVRSKRRPAILRLRTVRLLGHAGSDVEQLYRSQEEIDAAEALDPLRASATLLVREGWLTPDQVVWLYEETRARSLAMGREVVRRPPLETAEAVMAPLFHHDADAIAAAVPVADDATRLRVHGGSLPEASDRPRHLAIQLNRALTDVLAGDGEAILFGEDVAQKGGVYHVTADLVKRFGVGRVFNTLLDEQTILGMAIGAAHAGMLPLPEIQYLAYLMNAVDQLRGEAGSLQFFSNGQYANGMVVRIAGLAYQKGFGGHFHNDNGIAAVREIPGILLGCPSRGDDAARMLRTMVGAARACGRVCVLLEPIALYMTKDLLDDDGAWLTTYPEPHAVLPVDEVGVYGEGTDACIVSFANGLWMSLRVARRLEAEGVRCRVIDLRWLQPLPLAALEPHAAACGRVLVVDECRASSGVADTISAHLHENVPGVRVRRVTGRDTYIPLGGAANLVLVQEHDIEAGLRQLLEVP